MNRERQLRFPTKLILVEKRARGMHRDFSTGAFSGLQVFVLAVFLLVAGTIYGLYALGLPAEWSGAVFIILVVGSFAVSRPLYKSVEPRFDW